MLAKLCRWCTPQNPLSFSDSRATRSLTGDSPHMTFCRDVFVGNNNGTCVLYYAFNRKSWLGTLIWSHFFCNRCTFFPNGNQAISYQYCTRSTLLDTIGTPNNFHTPHAFNSVLKVCMSSSNEALKTVFDDFSSLLPASNWSTALANNFG